MNGDSPGPGWWQGSDGEWYIAAACGQVHAAERALGLRLAPAARSPSPAFRAWARTAQGIISMLTGVAVLSAGGIVISANSGPSHIHQSGREPVHRQMKAARSPEVTKAPLSSITACTCWRTSSTTSSLGRALSSR
jgi:hypothetical protein